LKQVRCVGIYLRVLPRHRIRKPEEGEDGEGMPGFTVGSGLIGIVSAVYLLRNRAWKDEG